jgi:hypothetical protein
MTLADLANRMQTLAERVPLSGNRVAVQVATALEQQLVVETPVDTSKALSNWQVATGEQPQAPIPPYFAGLQGSTRASSAEAAINAANAALRAKKPGSSVWVSNLLPYIQRLNQGWSKQAPAGYVDAAIIKAQLVIANKDLGF